MRGEERRGEERRGEEMRGEEMRNVASVAAGTWGKQNARLQNIPYDYRTYRTVRYQSYIYLRVRHSKSDFYHSKYVA